MKKLWGGRFGDATHPDVEAFTGSLAVDGRLWKADITASIAHGRMLGLVGVLPREEADAIVSALEAMLMELEAGATALPPGAEDVHSGVEQLLAGKVGSLAGKLHTGRSRNDQVATATRLHMRGEVDGAVAEILSLQRTLVALAEEHLHTILPGTTHLQHAQPVSLAHHLMAYFWMLERDKERLTQCRARVNSLPLGSAALAGTSFPLDRQAVARELGFESLCENSLDAVSDRDFAVELLASGSLVMSHLSRLAEELVLWSTPEFGFVTLSDGVTTGSSILPQKKNPDVAELIRGRVGRLTGSLMGMLTVLKALPLSYNRDLQEDKVHLFEGVDTFRACLRLTDLLLKEAKFHGDRMGKAVAGDFSNATDLADALVRGGMPFRDAHEVVGKIVRTCLGSGEALEEMSPQRLKELCPSAGPEVLARLKPEAVLEARTTRGGTSPNAVATQIQFAKERLSP